MSSLVITVTCILTDEDQIAWLKVQLPPVNDVTSLSWYPDWARVPPLPNLPAGPSHWDLFIKQDTLKFRWSRFQNMQ